MEQVRDLNMEADDMQVVLSAISSVSRRIKEVAQTHKPLFGREHFRNGQGSMRAAVYPVPVPCRTIAIGRLLPTRNLQEKSSTKLRT